MSAKLFILAPLCLSAQPLIDSIAGVGPNQRDLVEGRVATEAVLGEVHAIALDGRGGLLIGTQRLIVGIDAEGVAHAVAGTGTMNAQDGFAGDNIPAQYAPIAALRGIARAPDGTIYFSDNQSVRRLNADGLVTTVLPQTAGYISPRGVALDSAGNLYVAVRDVSMSQVRGAIVRVTPQGQVAPIALRNPDGTPATLNQLEGVAVDADGNLYVTSYVGNRVFRIAGGVVTTVAGTGRGALSGDGGPAVNAELWGPSGVAVAADGTLYIADTFNNRIRVVTPDGIIRSLDTPPLLAPAQVAIDPSSAALYVTEYNGRRVSRIASGMVTTVAGNGERMAGPAEPGDGGPSRIARLNQPEGIAYCAGVVYVADTSHALIRKITPDDWIDSVAGNGQIGGAREASGDGGPAREASIGLPSAVACDGHGNLYIADRGRPRIRKVDASGIISTLLGDGTLNNPELRDPRGIAVDGSGNVFVTDRFHSRLLRIGPGGGRRVLWSGIAGVDFPMALAVDQHGRPHFSRHREPGRERTAFRLEPDGSLTHIAGSGMCFSQEIPDGTPARQADFCDLFSIAFNEQGLLFLSDRAAVYAIDAAGTTRRIAGRWPQPTDIGPIPLGDGGPAASANLSGAVAIAVGEIGLFAIQGIRVRKVPF